MAAKEVQLIELLKPEVEALGCDFWGLEFLQQGRHGMLRVYIDRDEEGVSVDDCANVSRQIGSVLDVEDVIPNAFTLEVSSPGVDRRLFTLDQCTRYLGETIKLKSRTSIDGQRNFSGVLSAVEGEEVVLRVGDEEFLFPFEIIERATVVPTFE